MGTYSLKNPSRDWIAGYEAGYKEGINTGLVMAGFAIFIDPSDPGLFLKPLELSDDITKENLNVALDEIVCEINHEHDCSKKGCGDLGIGDKAKSDYRRYVQAYLNSKAA